MFAEMTVSSEPAPWKKGPESQGSPSWATFFVFILRFRVLGFRVEAF